MPKFSIIVPIYNVALYLRECLDSILSQTINDFEVIAVDDGSTDGTSQIIDDYARKNQQIIVLHKANLGVGSARNAGIEMSKGEYLCFVDGDDIVASTYLQDLYEALGDSDSSMGGFLTFGLPNSQGRRIVPSMKTIDPIEDNLLRFYDIHNSLSQRYLWNRLFKASVIREFHIRFREDIFYKEDGLFVVLYLCRSNGLVGITNSIVYFYRRNPSGAIGTVNKGYNPKLVSSLSAHRLIIQALEERHISHSIITQAKIQAQNVSIWILRLLFRSGNKNPTQYFNLGIYTLRAIGLRSFTSFCIKSVVKVLK